MGKHNAPPGDGPITRVRAYVAKHVDRVRQLGRDMDDVPDAWLESLERLATDKDRWDR